jgi:hypothetical protein
LAATPSSKIRPFPQFLLVPGDGAVDLVEALDGELLCSLDRV